MESGKLDSLFTRSENTDNFEQPQCSKVIKRLERNVGKLEKKIEQIKEARETAECQPNR